MEAANNHFWVNLHKGQTKINRKIQKIRSTRSEFIHMCRYKYYSLLIQHQEKWFGSGEYIGESFWQLTPGGTRVRWPRVIGCWWQIVAGQNGDDLRDFHRVFSLFKANLLSATSSLGVKSIMNRFSPSVYNKLFPNLRILPFLGVYFTPTSANSSANPSANCRKSKKNEINRKIQQNREHLETN